MSIHEEAQRLREQRESRERNLDALPLAEADLRKLDASVKRNTALIKRLRGVSEESKAGLLEEISRTNQSKVIIGAVAGSCNRLNFCKTAAFISFHQLSRHMPTGSIKWVMCVQYVSEAVAAIAEANVKTKDIAAAVEVSSSDCARDSSRIVVASAQRWRMPLWR